MDLAWMLWRHGYRAIPEERARHDGADAFGCHLLGRRALVVRGPDGARAFYDQSLVQRKGAIPPPLAALLFGTGAVHGLDGAEHLQRKQMFLDLLTEDRIAPLVAAVAEQLRRRARAWHGPVDVFSELVEIYGTAVVSWAGIPISRRTARRVAGRLAWIVDGFGFAPGAYARAWACRLWADRWARGLIEDVRAGRMVPPAGTALAVIAASPLPATVAAVELINVLRPTVAVAWPGTFAAHALAQHPQWRGLLQDQSRCEAFAHEARRRYPFVPALAGRIKQAGEVLGEPVQPGQFLVLDVVGTHHDRSRWSDPQEFRPERFADVDPDPYGFVPQGGGDARTGHRCPGEPLTVALLAATVRVLADLAFVPSSTTYSPARIPTRPQGALVVQG